MNLEIIHLQSDGNEKDYPLNQDRLLIGNLPSNQICILGENIEAIHAMLERKDDDTWCIIDLGSKHGVYVNGHKIDVEYKVGPLDRVQIGSETLKIQEPKRRLPPTSIPKSQSSEATKPAIGVPKSANEMDAPQFASDDLSPSINLHNSKNTVATKNPIEKKPIEKKSPSIFSRNKKKVYKRGPVLFASQKPKSSGEELEVIGYWGKTVLDIELFSKSSDNEFDVIIGDDNGVHFPGGGGNPLKQHRLATVNKDGFEIFLLPEMKGTAVISGSKRITITDKSAKLSRKDIAQISYGSIHYFLMYIKSPEVILPPTKSRDPLFAGLLSLSLIFYCLFIPYIWTSPVQEKEKLDDDPWTIVNVPTKKEPPKVAVKKKINLAKVKKPKTPKPPPPKKKPVVPKPPKEKKKIVKKIAPKKPKKTAIAKAKAPSKSPVKKAKKKNSSAGMASTGARRPNMKLAGAKNKGTLGKAGGNKGAGNGAKGGVRKGKKSFSVKGVEGKKNSKASGVNLTQLGLGIGKILDKTGAGAINTNFKSAAGGAGGGAGSGVKTVGLGGLDKGKSLSLAGGANGSNFGSGSGGKGSGQGGLGGLGGAGLGSGFGKSGNGKGRAKVVVPPGDPVVSGGLTEQEVRTVIQANLNQIRHCYEQLLQRSPSSSGKIKVNFKIIASGRVSTCKIQSSTIADSIMRNCVVSRVKRWVFPNPRGGVEVAVNYPFVFNPL